MPSKQTFDAIVIGGGAAGLMCAIEAGKRGRKVAVLEHADRLGKKILISGGGRCNFTNIHCTPANFISANPHFAKSALSRYTPSDFIELVEKHGIAYHEKTLGQLFCDSSARQIVAMLEQECAAAGVSIFLNVKVQQVERSGSGFLLRTNDAEIVTGALVIASGGLSIPKMGATSLGYDIASQFGLKIQECRPALVPFTFNAGHRRRYCDLTGLSAEVIAATNGSAFREKMLITHQGLSGPAILQASSYWKPGDAVHIDLAPEKDVFGSMMQSPAGRDLSAAKTALRNVLPARFAERWMELHEPPRWTNNHLAELEKQLHDWRLIPEGTEGYAKAEVTVGGVDTDELSAKTMETRKVPGLFFIGEVVDVTGHLGGFNFQWAWASGYAAGQAL
jgi:predicted Rossmann fold flavoprotein